MALRAGLHDLAGPELVAAVEEVDLRGEAGQVERLLDGRVAAPDHGDRLVAEEEAVAGGARRDAVSAEPLLGRQAEPDRRGAGRDDDGLAAVLGAARPRPEGAAGEVDAVGVDVDDARPEALGLLAEAEHQLRALDPFGEARVVLDVGRDHQLAAGLVAGQDDRRQVGAGGVDGGGQAGRARADDERRSSRADRRRAGVGESGTAARGAASPAAPKSMAKPPKGEVVSGIGRTFSCCGGRSAGAEWEPIASTPTIPPGVSTLGAGARPRQGTLRQMPWTSSTRRAASSSTPGCSMSWIPTITCWAPAPARAAKRSAARLRASPSIPAVGRQARALQRRPLDLLEGSADGLAVSPRGSRTCGAACRGRRRRSSRPRTGRPGGASSARRRRRS